MVLIAMYIDGENISINNLVKRRQYVGKAQLNVQKFHDAYEI